MKRAYHNNSVAIMNRIRTFNTASLAKKSSEVSSLIRRDCMKIFHYVASCLQEEPLFSDDEGDDNRVTDDDTDSENLGTVCNDFDAKQSLINVNKITNLDFANSQCTSSTIDCLEDPLDFRAIPQEILDDGFLKQDELDSSRWVIDSPLFLYGDIDINSEEYHEAVLHRGGFMGGFLVSRPPPKVIN